MRREVEVEPKCVGLFLTVSERKNMRHKRQEDMDYETRVLLAVRTTMKAHVPSTPSGTPVACAACALVALIVLRFVGVSQCVDSETSRGAMCFFFFFQAEDGIRDYKVTGVQTCALPI